MAASDVSAVMLALGDALRAADFRAYDYPPDQLAVPAVVIAFPETVEYDSTMGRGSDRLVVPVHALVGRMSDRTARERLGAYLSGGPGGVKAAIEADPTLGNNASTTRVMSAEVSVMTVAAVDYLAASFQIELLT